MNRAGILILALACACSEKSPAAADAPLEIDGDVRPDASLDAEIDAAVDAPVDAPPDAPSASPRCTTMASTLIDVSPRRLGNLVVAGNVLYATVYDLGPSETVINAAVLSIDLTTETQAAAPLSTTAAPFLTTNGTDVYAPDVNQIWRLRNGMAPVTVVTNRPGVLIAIGDATHVYWSESNQTGPDPVYRQLLTGGPVEMVTTCEGASALIRAGSEIYCTQFGGALLHAPVTGGAPVFIPYANGYPIHTLTLDGSDLYFVNMYNNPQIYRVPLPNGPMVMLDQHPSIKRFWGLALSADSIYVTGYQLRRFNRTTLVDEAIYTAHSSSSNPVLWNDDLYFAAENRQSGYRLIMHCVD